MGARQSKRSVDITTTPKNSKSTTGEGTIVVEDNSQGGDDIKVGNIKVEESKVNASEETGTAIVTDKDTAEDKDKDNSEDVEKGKEKEKVKKRWSFRSISFTKKDKNKPGREKLSKNGEISKEDVAESLEETPAAEAPKISEAAGDFEKKDESVSPVEESKDEIQPKETDNVVQEVTVPVVSDMVKTNTADIEKPVELSSQVTDAVVAEVVPEVVMEVVTECAKKPEETVTAPTLDEPKAESEGESVTVKIADEIVKDAVVLEKEEEKVDEILHNAQNTICTNNIETESDEVNDICKAHNEDSTTIKEEVSVEKTVDSEEIAPVPVVETVTTDTNNIEEDSDIDVLPPPLPESPAPVHTETSKIANFAESTMEQKEFPPSLPTTENEENCPPCDESVDGIPASVQHHPKEQEALESVLAVQLKKRLADTLQTMTVPNDQSTDFTEKYQVVPITPETAIDIVTLHNISLSENNVEQVKNPAPVITEDVTSVTKAIEEITISEKAVAAAVDEAIKSSKMNEVVVDTMHQNTMNE